MISEFSAYTPLNELLPKEPRKIVSNFHVEHEKYVLGIWVARESGVNQGNVVPLYLTEEQLKEVKENAIQE